MLHTLPPLQSESCVSAWTFAQWEPSIAHVQKAQLAPISRIVDLPHPLLMAWPHSKICRMDQCLHLDCLRLLPNMSW